MSAYDNAIESACFENIPNKDPNKHYKPGVWDPVWRDDPDQGNRAAPGTLSLTFAKEFADFDEAQTKEFGIQTKDAVARMFADRVQWSKDFGSVQKKALSLPYVKPIVRAWRQAFSIPGEDDSGKLYDMVYRHFLAIAWREERKAPKEQDKEQTSQRTNHIRLGLAPVAKIPVRESYDEGRVMIQVRYGQRGCLCKLSDLVPATTKLQIDRVDDQILYDWLKHELDFNPTVHDLRSRPTEADLDPYFATGRVVDDTNSFVMLAHKMFLLRECPLVFEVIPKLKRKVTASPEATHSNGHRKRTKINSGINLADRGNCENMREESDDKEFD